MPLNPFQIVSLYEMLQFHAERFLNIHDRLDALARGFKDEMLGGDAVIAHEVMAFAESNLNLTGNLSYITVQCQEAGLKSAFKQLTYMANLLSAGPAKYIQLQTAFEELQKRIYEDLSEKVFMKLPEEDARFYEKSDLFGERVSRKFRAVRAEIQEAGTCFAVGRYTATVFHLMRVMEVGVQRLGKKLGIPDTKEKEWQTILNGVTNALKSLSSPPVAITPQQKAFRDKYAQAVALLENVKNAWRNKTMHPKKSYDDREAERVLIAVGSYMEYLATIL